MPAKTPLPPQIRDIKHLCLCVRERWQRHTEILWEEHKIAVSTIETIRDIERQRYYVKKKVSKTMKSFHLPQKPSGLALAYDIVPAEYLTEPDWNEDGSHWKVLGEVGMGLGLDWGFDLWKWDKPHFQLTGGCDCE